MRAPAAPDTRSRATRAYVWSGRGLLDIIGGGVRDQGEAGGDNGVQAHDQHRVVVGGEAVRVFLAAAEAAVQKHLLAITAGEDADRLHQGVALAAPVAGHGVVDVPRVEAVRAMVAMAPARQRRADELLAVAALERLVGLGPWRTVQPGTFPRFVLLCGFAAA